MGDEHAFPLNKSPQRVGPERLVLGSDYPVGFLRDCGVEGEARAAITGGTAARLPGLS